MPLVIQDFERSFYQWHLAIQDNGLSVPRYIVSFLYHRVFVCNQKHEDEKASLKKL